jgi:hypothetical protein
MVIAIDIVLSKKEVRHNDRFIKRNSQTGKLLGCEIGI